VLNLSPFPFHGKSNLIEAKENLVNYYGGKELAASFRTVRKNTLTVAQDIPEDKYTFRAAPETRSVGELLAHIALSNGFQKQIHAEERRMNLEGFDFPSLMKRLTAEEKAPRTKAQLIELLTTDGEAWAKWLEGLDDNFLGEVVTMPPTATPPSRTRFDMLLSVKEHEMHHRGQLMLIERILGIVPHLTRRMQERFAANAARK
jgi:uncharacterized damage-inducible protein DinB